MYVIVVGHTHWEEGEGKLQKVERSSWSFLQSMGSNVLHESWRGVRTRTGVYMAGSKCVLQLALIVSQKQIFGNFTSQLLNIPILIR